MGGLSRACKPDPNGSTSPVCNYTTTVFNCKYSNATSVPSTLTPGSNNQFSSSSHCKLLNCKYFNARSLKSKLNDLHNVLYSFSFNIICISETWLNDKITDGLLDPKSRFNIFRCDRTACLGGGVCIFVSKAVRSHQIDIDYAIYKHAEVVACTIFIGRAKVNVVCCYIPPSANNDLYRSSVNCLRHICEASTICPCIIIGDFNLPNLDWSRTNSDSAYDFKSLEFLDFINDYGFAQLITEPTRLSNTLDLLLVNDPLIISDFTLDASFCTSDHDSIIFNILLDTATALTAHSEAMNRDTRPDWDSADWRSFEQFCRDYDWPLAFTTCCDANSCWDVFYNLLSEGINLFVPLKTAFSKGPPKHSKAVRKLTARRKLLWRKAKAFPSQKAQNDYRNASAQLKIITKHECAEKEKHIINSGNTARFYRHINSRMNHRSGIAPLRNKAGELVTDDQAKAEILNTTFVDNGTVDNHILPTMPEVIEQATLSTIYIDSYTVYSIISNLNPKSAAGPDGLPPILFRQLSLHLSEPLAILFRLLMQFGEVPDKWKQAVVTPIFKKGPSSNPENYRPISLTYTS